MGEWELDLNICVLMWANLYGFYVKRGVPKFANWFDRNILISNFDDIEIRETFFVWNNGGSFIPLEQPPSPIPEQLLNL